MLTFADKENLSRGFEQYLAARVKRKGKYYLCPFHNDRNPSANLIISNAPKSNGLPVFFCSTCYSAKTDGFWDFLSFIMKFEQCDFKTALQRAQDESGYTLPEWQGKFKRRAALAQTTGPAKYDLSSGKVDIEAVWATVFGEISTPQSEPPEPRQPTIADTNAAAADFEQTMFSSKVENATQMPTNALESADGSQVKQTPYPNEKSPTPSDLARI